MNVTEVMSPAISRVRAYFAPVNRVAQQPTIFDPAQNGNFPLDAPPAPWVDLGWITGFQRTSATAIVPLKTGAPASTSLQTRTDLDAAVQFAFESWGKLQLSLAAGTQQMNLLAPQAGTTAAGSGGEALTAVAVGSGSTASALQVGSSSNMFSVDCWVAVDVDNVAGTKGYVGSGVSGACLAAPVTDIDYIRRVTLNVARVSSIENDILNLESPLIAGVPVDGMKVSSVLGFCDREGSSFFQEWSALFIAEGQQGERVIWFYPRLQTSTGIGEKSSPAPGDYQALRLAGAFRALPVIDPVDGERVVCFRSYITG